MGNDVTIPGRGGRFEREWSTASASSARMRMLRTQSRAYSCGICMHTSLLLYLSLMGECSGLTVISVGTNTLEWLQPDTRKKDT